MPASQKSPVRGFIRSLAAVEYGRTLSDRELLECFTAGKDETAFAALVKRHGPMVLSLCRRILHEQDAQDAFQATFLVLSKKAASLRPQQSLGGWLHSVAYRIAQKSRVAAARRRNHERRAADKQVADPLTEISVREARAILDRELARLPDKLRAPLVLCYLEDLTRDEAARRLGLSPSTLKSRLEQARERLQRRLRSRGLGLSGALVACLFCERAAEAAVPGELLISTINAATNVAAGRTAAGLVSAKAAALAEGVMSIMLIAKLKCVAAVVVLLSVLLLGLGVGLSGDEPQPDGKGAKKSAPVASAKKTSRKPAEPETKAGRIYLFLDGLRPASIQPDGKDLRELPALNADVNGFQSHMARLSPDGKRIAFGKSVIEMMDGKFVGHYDNKVYLRDLADKSETKILAEIGVEVHHLAWSHDGAKLAVVAWSKDHSGSWIIDVKTEELTEVKTPRFRFKDKEYSAAVQDWSPDGKQLLAFGGGDFYLVKTDGSGSRRLCRAGNVMGGTSRFSPDGRKILFAVVNKNHSMNLHVADLATGQVRAVVEALNFGEVHACWSPDSRRIAYCVTMLDADGKRTGETCLHVTDAEGKSTRRVLSETHNPQAIRLQLEGWR
jgi:RNA polymerase sigma factor (sigma-70 family)